MFYSVRRPRSVTILPFLIKILFIKQNNKSKTRKSDDNTISTLENSPSPPKKKKLKYTPPNQPNRLLPQTTLLSIPQKKHLIKQDEKTIKQCDEHLLYGNIYK